MLITFIIAKCSSFLSKSGEILLRVKANETLCHHLMLINGFVLTSVSTDVLQGAFCQKLLIA